MVRTRIAPSPTGYPHIGTIYQALFDYAFAKKNKGDFIIRIEDTDRARFIADAEEKLYEAIDWFGVTENESPRKQGKYGPYKQSERLSLYHHYAQELLDQGHAYFAYYPKADAGKKTDYSAGAPAHVEQTPVQSPPKTIEEMIARGDWVLRMKVPQGQPVVIRDEIRGDIPFASEQITEQVLIKSDGFPTYHLAVVVDDHLMKITHIVRGEEWINSTPKHVLLYDYLGWEKPLFFHTPLLRNPDKSKLSKRHSHTSVSWYHNEGYLPEAILNFLALMGWTHPEEKEIFSFSEFIMLFELKDIRSVGPIFDLVKLNWINGMYIRNLSVKELAKRLRNFIKEEQILQSPLYQDNDAFEAIVALSHERIATLKQFEEVAGHFFQTPPLSEEHTKLLQDLHHKLSPLAKEDWQKEKIFFIIKEIMVKEKLKMPVFYKIFTGKERGLPLPETLTLLGKEKTLARLKADK